MAQPLQVPKSILDPVGQQLKGISDTNIKKSDELTADANKKSEPFNQMMSDAFAKDKDISAKENVAYDAANKAGDEQAQFAEHNLPSKLDIPDFKPEKINMQDMQAFGAIMTAFALIGGRGTLNPMVTAGNALAGAIKGYNEGNTLKFEQDYKVYKTNFDKSVKNHEDEVNQYKEVLNAKSMNVSSKMRQAELIARGHNDVKMAEAFATHNLTLIEKGLKDKQTHLDKVTESETKSLEWAATYAENLKTHKEHEREFNVRMAETKQQHAELNQYRQDMLEQKIKKEAKASNVKLSVAEEKATTNYAAMENSDSRIDKLVKSGVTLPVYTNIKEDDNGIISVYGEYGRQVTLNDDQQELLQSSKQFAEGAGHLKSGARINKQTMDIMRDLYLPMNQDSTHTKQVKSEARKNDLLAATVAGGKGIELYNKLKSEQSSGETDTTSSGNEIQFKEDSEFTPNSSQKKEIERAMSYVPKKGRDAVVKMLRQEGILVN